MLFTVAVDCAVVCALLGSVVPGAVIDAVEAAIV